MFGFKPNPIKKLTSKHNDVLKRAMLAQRNGDIQTYADLIVEAEKIAETIQSLKNESLKN